MIMRVAMLFVASMLCALGIVLAVPHAAAQDPAARGRILQILLARIVCCSDDLRFTKPALSSNIPDNLGLGIAPGAHNDALIQIGQITRAATGKPVLKDAYSLDESCHPVSVKGVSLPPTANFFTLGEIASLKPRKNTPEQLWPVLNATFQSTLLGAMKLPSPAPRHTCLRQHLERVIHGEEGEPQ